MAIEINDAGVREFLRTAPQVREELQRAADAMADNVRGQGIRVGSEDAVELPVLSGTYDRGDVVEGVVTLAHAAGEAVQAKHGSLTKAAAQVGLNVQGGAP